MLIPHATVIALVDGQHFSLLRNAGTEAAPDLQELPAPRLDSHNHSGGGHRSSPGNHADSLVAEDAYAIAVADWLNQEVLAHRIAGLVIIAAPRTLGELRRHLHKHTTRAVLRELAKDLSGRAPAEVLAALRG